MRIKSVKIKNFRSYINEIQINFDNFTTIIGKNDAGKSTILEALDIFFNDAKYDEYDTNYQSRKNGDNTFTISVCFTDLPESTTINESVEISLEKKYMLNQNKELEIIKKYEKNQKTKVFIKAYDPTKDECRGLLLKPIDDLKDIAKKFNININDIDKRKSSEIRKAIWDHFSGDLELKEIEIGANAIWNKLLQEMPKYYLFKADRTNNDSDSEIQDPLKIAVKSILDDNEIKNKLKEIAEEVAKRINETSDKTLEKLNEMDEQIATSLKPNLNVDNLKWDSVFKNISITGDNDIPINKRGSGVKRLILLSYFRAQVEADNKKQNIIYAIEEPETSQHADKIQLLVKTFNELSQKAQIITTTHSSIMVRSLEPKNLRLIVNNKDGKSIKEAQKWLLPYVSLNEINFLVFDDVSEAYHDELYSEIVKNEKKGYSEDFEDWSKQNKKIYFNQKTGKTDDISLSQCIRNQIHHPENDCNPKYTKKDLKNSINIMIEYLKNKQQNSIPLK